MTAEEAQRRLVDMLELEPMGDRPDGRATWDDVVAYVAKALGTRTVAMETVRRRSAMLANALEEPAGTPYPELVTLVRQVYRRAEDLA